jgi:ABC-type multidrug transport system ATPase subunit
LGDVLPRPLAEATGVTRRFGAFTAVDDVSIVVAPGEIVGLLGANGAGKTTLIRMMLGLLRPTAGHVALLGETPSRRTRRRLGYVPQGLGLYVDMSVTENVEFNTGAFGAELTTEALGPDLAGLGDRLVGEIGLGRQRQLAFACAIAHRPEILVLDEPTSGVDPLARARLWDRIRAESERGVAVLVTTHYMQEAQQCDRLVMMASGRVVASGSEGDIVGDLAAVEVTGDSWSEAFSTLADAGYQVTLDGRRVRVPAVDPAEVAAVLEAASLGGRVASVPARLDEAMVVLSR